MMQAVLFVWPFKTAGVLSYNTIRSCIRGWSRVRLADETGNALEAEHVEVQAAWQHAELSR